ncbi:ParB/RepB/Spo0J family partition protein [Streptomyces caniscabiei]|uniref:ParB/RepB/Spo0J family partition protein n=1 Tax=Streptomyces caniscabiei TaxID=2746961 RepID=UPI0029A2D742|nr:ParB N-terminal domain-containing protein [Streptomyces caniscabiei]MDX2947912.1 ParB N-terminal domain-containing protein [Streptomyces caniscabiei]MDX2986447.1 ParB N-terminal domain-containing protein [Streptomyces caniscabiei]
MGRRTSLATLAGAPVDTVPGQSEPLLMSLPLAKVVPTRFNPRRRFGTEEELREFGQKLAKSQLQPAVVVSRAGYLKLWPEEAEHVGDASYVIANGERRYRASLLVGRPTLDVVHKEDVARSRADFLDAVQSENNDRENLDPIERALGIDIMVAQIGGADPVAVYYGKTKGWVSQQRKLLKLTPELQELVAVGELPVRVARDIAGLPAEVQGKAWEEELERRRLEKEAGARLRAERRDAPPAPRPTPVPERFTAVNRPDLAPALNPGPAPAPNPVPSGGYDAGEAGRNNAPAPDADGQAETRMTPEERKLPEPRSQQSPEPQDQEGRRQTKMPWDDGAACAEIVIAKMPRPERLRMMDRLLEYQMAENTRQPASAEAG